MAGEQKIELGAVFGEVPKEKGIKESPRVRAALIEDVTGTQAAEDGEGLSFGLRSDLTKLGSLANKQRRFKQEFPEGELFQVDLPFPLQGESTLVFRRNLDEPLREVIPGGGAGLPEMAGAATSPEVLAPLAGQALFGIPGLIGGSLAGPFISEGSRRQLGFEPEMTMGEAGVEGGIQTGINLATDIATRGAVRGARALAAGGPTREGVAGMVRPSAGAEAMTLAGEREGLPPLRAGQVAEEPATFTLFQQGTILTPRGEQLAVGQRQAVRRRLEEKANEFGMEGLSTEELQQLADFQRAEISKRLRGTLNAEGDATTGGTAIQEGIQQFDKTTAAMGGRMYQNAAEFSPDLAFDVSRTVNMANRIEEGTITRTRAQPVERPGGAIIGPNGQPLTPPTTEMVQGTQAVEGGLPKELREVIDTLQSMDPLVRDLRSPMTGEISPGFEQIKKLRSRLFELRFHEDGRVSRGANQLWRALTTDLANPAGQQGPKFARAWKQANQFWADREAQLEKQFVQNFIRTDQPERIFSALTRPTSYTALAEAARTVPKPAMERFKSSFMASLIAKGEENPRLIVSQLNRFKGNERALRMLVSEPEEKALRDFAQELDLWQKGPINKAINDISLPARRAVDIVSRNSEESMQALVRDAGGMDSKVIRSMRAGLYQEILDKATTVTRDGSKVIDAKRMMAEIERLQQMPGFKSVMRPSDIETLTNLELYTSPLRSANDAGTSIMKAEISQQLGAVTQPRKMIAGGHKLLNNRAAAWILSSPASSKVLNRAKKVPFGLEKLRFLTVGAVAARRELQQGTGLSPAEQRVEELPPLEGVP